MKRVAHVLAESSGGIRRAVRYLAGNPPPGYETAGVVGPETLREYFDDILFRPLEGLRPWQSLYPDLVHAHGFTAAARTVAGARITGPAGSPGKAPLPVVVTVHTAPSQTLRAGAPGTRQRGVQRLMWLAGRTFAERADALIAVSGEVAAGLRGAVVIPPAIELPAAVESRSGVREKLGTPPDKVVVLAVGRLHPDKALDLYIDALQGTEAEGWIAGEGPERPGLERIAAGTSVRLLGQRDDVGSLLGAADIFALPATGEAYGFAVMEALAAGLPVVATRTGAISELGGDAAVLVDPGDRRGFIRATRRLIADPALRAELAEKARQRRLPSPSELVAEVGRVYDKALGHMRGDP